VKCAATLAFFLVLAFPVASRATDDATWLKYAHRAYTGFTFGDGTIHTLAYDFTDTYEKKAMSNGHAVRVGLAYRENVHWSDENIESSDGFTGSLFWYADSNGFATGLRGNDVPPTYAEDLIETDAIAVLPWTYQGTVKDSGADLAMVRVTLNNGFPIELYVDRATGAYRRAVLDPGGAYEMSLQNIVYTEARPGVRVISAIQFGNDGDLITVNHIAVNPVVSESDLQPPPRTAQWQFGTGAIPLTLTHDRIVVHAAVNGVTGTFLLDTGAAGIFFTGDFARRAHIAKATGHGFADSLYGSEKIDVGRVEALKIGDSTLTNALVYYGMAPFDVWGPDGLLGYGALAGAYVSLDLKDATMTLRDAADVDPSSTGGIVLPASFAEGQPSIPMLLNKSLVFDAVVDTGNPGGVVIPARIISGYGLHFYQSDAGPCGKLDTLSIGALNYDSPDACVAYGGGGRWLLAGMDFLRRFDRVDFDYPLGDVVLFPKKP